LKKTIRVLCFVTINKPSFLGVALANSAQHDTWTAVHTVIDTWGKRCSKMIMFGNVPDIQVDSIPFLAVRNDHGNSWKALAQVLSQVIVFLSSVEYFNDLTRILYYSKYR